jgi:SAM-dependent methyltransferase
MSNLSPASAVSDEPENAAAFDAYAREYDAALAQGISASGEDKTYFAQGRVTWLAGFLSRLGEPAPPTILDFGCGTGSATPYLLEALGAGQVVGVDVSDHSLQVARQTHVGLPASFRRLDEYQPSGQVDLAFCNGVFHHIPLDERVDAVAYVYRSLRPGGLFAFWENNPWNPGTRYVMSRIPFDRDAITLTPPHASHLLRTGGFEVLRIDYAFIFPRMLAALRSLEPRVSRLPLGAQYQILCRKPITNPGTL